MNSIKITLIFLLIILGFYGSVFAQDEVTIVAPTVEAAEGLDLNAVSELFKESENLESFERALNDPENGINNLDLDENGEVDFIRIIEEAEGETHIIILQAVLGDEEFQDVASIEIEKTGNEEYNLHVRGEEEIYGEDYYFVPVYVHVYKWPIVPWIYRPVYRPYRSVYRFGYYPHWWKVYHPVKAKVYRSRIIKINNRKAFKFAKAGRVKTVHKVKYKPRSSTRVEKKRTVIKKDKYGVKKTTVKRVNKNGKKVTVKKTTTIKKKRPNKQKRP